MSAAVLELESQLRQAETRRADLERQYAEALRCPPVSCDPLDTRQSRVRELEKKVALETVRVEELQLELAAARRAASTLSTPALSAPSVAPQSHFHQQQHHHHQQQQHGTEIERIMAKIEQDNRILAELEHSRSTTLSAPECQWGSGSGPSSLEIGMPSAVSAPVSPLPASTYSYAATHQSSVYSQPPFSSANIYSTTMPGAQNLAGVGQSMIPFSTGAITLPNQMGGTYTNHSYCNTIGIGSNPSATYSTSGALTSQQQPVYTNHTSYQNPMSLANPTPYNTNTSVLTNHSSFTNPLSSNLPGSLGYNPNLSNPSSYGNNVSFSNPLSATQWGSPAMNVKLKPLEEIELGRRIPTPVTPHVPSLWDRPLSRPTLPSGPSDCATDWGLPDGQVDMLDIPGKGRCSVYIARFSYEPEPDACEDEIAVVAGDYLLVWGEPGTAYLDAETLDGRRGLVPAHFAQRLVGDDLLEFHQAVLSSLRDEESAAMSSEMLAADVQRLCELSDINEEPEDESIESQVGAPRHLTLERQLNKSVLISWNHPEPAGQPAVESYHVYVDGVLKTTVKASERTRALVEGVDSNRPHRISVRSVTATRRTSRDAACTMVIGRDAHTLGPTAVRASHVTCSSAVISWLPANSNHQHVVCVNSVEVRTVKPGVYRHTITGLTPNTQYRVTVRAKHAPTRPQSAAAGPGAVLPSEEPLFSPAAAHTDFRTLPKGLPDPPADIQVEAGPQDGTLLVTWHPVQTQHHPTAGVVTGYAVYADGKKVTDVDSPTGDHALIDITKLLGLNPKHVTVRTKARDSQSADSIPTPIPTSVLRGGIASARRQPHTGLPPHVRPPQHGVRGPHGQQVIEHEDNLSDKEIFPTGQHHRQQGQQPTGIPQIEAPLSEDDYGMDGRQRSGARGVRGGPPPQPGGHQRPQQQHQGGPMQQQQYYQQQQQQQQQPQNAVNQQQGGPRNLGNVVGGNPGQMRRGGPPQQQMQQRPLDQNAPPPAAPKKARWFVALFDYDPTTMSPNPDACDEELPFSEGDSIKVWGDKDPDGFYWGECRGRRGFVPHNMVMEVEGPRAGDRDRWGDIYANMPVKRMVALYDYDPQELSPNVDAEVELSFTTGSIIHVYGEMDDDGFYMGELDGVRGLVPSNFLAEAPDEYATPGVGGAGARGANVPGGSGVIVGGGGVGGGVVGGSQQQQQLQQGQQGPQGQQQQGGPQQRGGGGGAPGAGTPRGIGPGAFGPPPPPRDANVRTAPQQRAKQDACPVVPSSQLDHTTNHTNVTVPPNTQASATEHQQRNQQQRGAQQRGTLGGNMQQQAGYGQQAQPLQQQQQTNQYQQQQTNQYQQQTNQYQQQPNQYQQPYQQQQQFQDMQTPRSQATMMKGAPQVLPTVSQPLQHPPSAAANAPNALMQKLNEMTAPGGDILSKGKELIFMKFGLGGK